MVLHIYKTVAFNILLFYPLLVPSRNLPVMNLLSEVMHSDRVPSRMFIVCLCHYKLSVHHLQKRKVLKLYHVITTTTNAVITGMIEWDTSVIYWTDRGLDRWGLMPEQRWNFSLHHHFQISSWACTGACQVGSGQPVLGS
jgi:hypothetical protein